ncbi:hypothetical protein T02_1254 [Trichinella nativa]|uniref:Uncharacterized protein n=1 Tax=Trichinella nativa TaxID=6335 RepID=A0A0V1LRS6_9BILA|nr:hypothetical protein T02_1254 [Trichinella nativa]
MSVQVSSAGTDDRKDDAEDEECIQLYSQILRVRASFNLAIESRRKQFDK